MQSKPTICFALKKKAYVSVDAAGRFSNPTSWSCEPGSFDDLLDSCEDEDVLEYVSLGEEDAFHEPLPASDYDPEEREDSAFEIDGFIDDLLSVGPVSLVLDWTELLEPILGPRPDGPPLRPPTPDLELAAAAAVRERFGTLSRMLPWTKQDRQRVAEVAAAEAQKQHDEEFVRWETASAAYSEAISEREAQEAEVLASAGPTWPHSQAWFGSELETLTYPLPIRCAATQTGTTCELRLVLPSLETDIPFTETKSLKSGRLTLKKASKKSRRGRWEQCCETLAMRVGVAALNAFPACSDVHVQGETPDDLDVHLKVRLSREELSRGGEVSFEAQGGEIAVKRPRRRRES